MHKVLRKNKVSAPTPKLSFDAVFDSGHVIFASNTATNVRLVSFENPTDYFKNHAVGSTQRAAQAAIGKGSSIEEAFKNALHNFYSPNKHTERRNLLSRSKQIQGSTKTTGALDRWLVEHKGTLRAVKDGAEVYCSLHGYRSGNHISMYGSGDSIHAALRQAFTQA